MYFVLEEFWCLAPWSFQLPSQIFNFHCTYW